MIDMRRIVLMLLGGLLVTGVAFPDIIASKIYVEKNPKPNMTEKYVPLKLVKTIGPEITSDVLLYKPIDLTLDNEGNLYVFDRLQHRIIKLDQSLKFVRYIGRDGKGPGEFTKNRFSPVFINVGLDNKLYCSDGAAFKILVFDLKGNYITDYRINRAMIHKPVVDKNGRLYLFSGDDQTLLAKDQLGETIFELPIRAKDIYSTLFVRQNVFQNYFDLFLSSSFLETGDLLLYFSSSSKVFNVIGDKISRNYRVLPKDRLNEYKQSVQKLGTKSKVVLPLFARIVPDGDNKGLYYLAGARSKEHNRSLLYQLSLDGKLQKTYYVERHGESGAIWFMAKKNNMFYAKRSGDEVVEIYKEEE
jgi:hypothetical protein